MICTQWRKVKSVAIIPIMTRGVMCNIFQYCAKLDVQYCAKLDVQYCAMASLLPTFPVSPSFHLPVSPEKCCSCPESFGALQMQELVEVANHSEGVLIRESLASQSN